MKYTRGINKKGCKKTLKIPKG